MTKDEVLGRKSKPSQVSVADGSKFIGAVFLYMFIALAITGIVATAIGLGFEKLLFNGQGQQFAEAYVIVLIVSLILYIPSMIVCQISAIKNSKAMVPSYVIYSITMGIFISTFTFFIPFWEIAVAFGGTCLAFGLMTLIAWFSRKNVNTLGVIGAGLLMGSLVLVCINLILSLFNVVVEPVMWVIQFIMLIAIILITIFDLRRVKDIAASGGAGNNVALLCALNLYVDFIYIFIRLLALLARSRR